MENGQFQRLVEEIQESRRHTDEVTAELRAHTDGVAAQLRAHTDGVAAELRAHTDGVAAQLRNEFTGLGTEMREATVEIKRYFDVVAEDLRADDRLLAEGLAAVDGKVDRLRGDMSAEFAETRAMIKLSYRELDRRLTTLEEGP